MPSNYFLCDASGSFKGLLNSRLAATIIGDGYGTWKPVEGSRVGYVMHTGRRLTLLAGQLNLYFQVGDFLLETDEPLAG